MMLKLEGIRKQFDQKKVLEPTSLVVDKGQKLGIVGETGSGKTTLLKIMAGLEQPTQGKVFLEGEEVLGPDEKLVPGHEAIAYLSQHFELPKFITVEQAIYDPYKISEQEVSELYKACKIEHLLEKDTRELSGGEKQRVALARILVGKPKLLLLDEPFSNLDKHHQWAIKEVIRFVENQLNTTIILVSHDPLDVLSWAEQILVMKSGVVIQQGTPQIIYKYPSDEYVAGLFGKYNLISLREWQRESGDYANVGDKVIVRPEMFRLSEKTDQGQVGEVTHIQYYGSREELTIALATGEITVSTSVGAFQVGDKIGVSLPQ